MTTADVKRQTVTASIKEKAEAKGRGGEKQWKLTVAFSWSKYPEFIYVNDDDFPDIQLGEQQLTVERAKKAKEDYDGNQEWMWKHRLVKPEDAAYPVYGPADAVMPGESTPKASYSGERWPQPNGNWAQAVNLGHANTLEYYSTHGYDCTGDEFWQDAETQANYAYAIILKGPSEMSAMPSGSPNERRSAPGDTATSTSVPKAPSATPDAGGPSEGDAFQVKTFLNRGEFMEWARDVCGLYSTGIVKALTREGEPPVDINTIEVNSSQVQAQVWANRKQVKK